MVWLSRTVDVVHRSPRFTMLIVLHCLNLKQQIDLSLYNYLKFLLQMIFATCYEQTIEISKRNTYTIYNEYILLF